MNIVVSCLALLFSVVVVARWRVVWSPQNRTGGAQARLSLLSAAFAAPALALLNTDFVHWLIESLPWLAGPIRVAPFVLALLAIWYLAEAAAVVMMEATSEGEQAARHGSLLEPLAWCVAVLIVFAFVDLDPLREVFTIVHATQLPGLVYTLIYYTGAALFAGRLAFRAAKSGRSTAFLLVAAGGALMMLGCLYQYVLLVPVYLRSPLPDAFYGVFDALFFAGILLIVAGLQVLLYAPRARSRRIRGLSAPLQRILETRKLVVVGIDDAERPEEVLSIFLQHVDDYSGQGRLELTGEEQLSVARARAWISQNLPLLSGFDEYMPST